MEGYQTKGVTGTVYSVSTSVYCSGIWLYGQLTTTIQVLPCSLHLTSDLQRRSFSDFVRCF